MTNAELTIVTRTMTELANEARSRDPAAGLQAVAALGRLLEQLESVHVRNPRAAGWSWSEIAACLGVSKQTVHRKHKDRG